MRYSVKNYEYKFRQPPLISEEEYYQIKMALSRDKGIRIRPRINYWEVYGVFLVYGILIFIGTILLSFDPDSTPGAILVGLGAIWAFITFIMTMSTMSSFSDYVGNLKRYYSVLKKSILKSKDYSEFKQLMHKHKYLS